jgi:hypothetical protein
MELNIIKIIKSLRNQLRRPKHKVMPIVEKIKKIKPTKSKRKVITAVVNGQELSLKNVARNYGLKLATVRARYRVGNRGKLLIRPAQGKKPT